MKKALVMLLGLLVVAPRAGAASRMTEAERGRVKAEIEAAVNALLRTSARIVFAPPPTLTTERTRLP